MDGDWLHKVNSVKELTQNAYMYVNNANKYLKNKHVPASYYWPHDNCVKCLIILFAFC